jgi:hypothetical protein
MVRVDLLLRQAILLNDVALVRRLLNHNPQYLHNPDFADKSNTSLHLAAQYGLEEISVGVQIEAAQFHPKPSRQLTPQSGAFDLSGS